MSLGGGALDRARHRRPQLRSPTASPMPSRPATATPVAASRTRRQYSPARVSQALTIGAIDRIDRQGVVVELREPRRLVRPRCLDHVLRGTRASPRRAAIGGTSLATPARPRGGGDVLAASFSGVSPAAPARGALRRRHGLSARPRATVPQPALSFPMRLRGLRRAGAPTSSPPALRTLSGCHGPPPRLRRRASRPTGPADPAVRRANLRRIVRLFRPYRLRLTGGPGADPVLLRGRRHPGLPAGRDLRRGAARERELSS